MSSLISSPGQILARWGFTQPSEPALDIVVEHLKEKLRVWKPEIADIVRRRVPEILELAVKDALDLMRSRAVEQEVLDLLGESSSR